MKKVIIESPLAGDFTRNIRYARYCMLDSLNRGEAPFASHLLYTQVLDDRLQSQRSLGMQAGFVWADAADLRVFYVDLGMSAGMRQAAERALANGQVIETRNLPHELWEAFNLGSEIDGTEEMYE